MKVRELIQALKRYNPEDIVRIPFYVDANYKQIYSTHFEVDREFYKKNPGYINLSLV